MISGDIRQILEFGDEFLGLTVVQTTHSFNHHAAELQNSFHKAGRE
jgi:hypothetical protein